MPRLHVELGCHRPREQVVIVGAHHALGAWDPTKGVPLEWTGEKWETQEPVHLTSINHSNHEYKFVPSGHGSNRWEHGRNRVLELSKGTGDVLLTARFNEGSAFSPLTPREVEARAARTFPSKGQKEDAAMWRTEYEKAVATLKDMRASAEAENDQWVMQDQKSQEREEALRSDLAKVQQEIDQLRQRNGGCSIAPVEKDPSEYIPKMKRVCSSASFDDIEDPSKDSPKMKRVCSSSCFDDIEAEESKPRSALKAEHSKDSLEKQRKVSVNDTAIVLQVSENKNGAEPTAQSRPLPSKRGPADLGSVAETSMNKKTSLATTPKGYNPTHLTLEVKKSKVCGAARRLLRSISRTSSVGRSGAHHQNKKLSKGSIKGNRSVRHMEIPQPITPQGSSTQFECRLCSATFRDQTSYACHLRFIHAAGDP